MEEVFFVNVKTIVHTIVFQKNNKKKGFMTISPSLIIYSSLAKRKSKDNLKLEKTVIHCKKLQKKYRNWNKDNSYLQFSSGIFSYELLCSNFNCKQ